MPSFFESMRRVLSGKPVYDENDIQVPYIETKIQPHEQQQTQQSLIRKGDANTYPVVYVKHVKTHLSGGHMEVSCHIENAWPEQIMLDKIRLLGTTHELDHYLQPHEEREFVVYKGPALLRQGDTQALLDYKTTREGDYFESVHEVMFKYLSDKTYDIADIRFHPPVRDIFG